MIKVQASNVFNKVCNSFKIPALWKQSHPQEHSQNQPHVGKGKDPKPEDQLLNKPDQRNDQSVKQADKPKKFWTNQVKSTQKKTENQCTHR